MRGWIVVVALACACKSGSKDKDKTAPPSNQVAAAPVVPKVSTPAVLAKEDGKPPFLLLVDAAGKLQLAAVATWAEVDTKDLRKGAKAGELRMLDQFTREVIGLGQDPVEQLAKFDPSDDLGIDLASLEDTRTRNAGLEDDPPPPEEEDRPDDGEDESGGTGTAMVLEEGKMGKRDSDRAEGQYKMQKNQEDPQLARQMALERARIEAMPATSPYGFYEGRSNEDGTPSRLAKVAGGISPDGKLDRLRMMVLATPALKATKLVEILAETRAAIGVAHAGKIRPLRIDFGMRDHVKPSPLYWLEVRVAANGPLVVEAVPDKPIEIAKLDELASALEKVRAARGASPDSNVDVLVDPSIDTQRLVDVLVALDLAGIRVIGIGEMPNAEETTRRGKRMPTAVIGQPAASGDLDKAEIRRVVRSSKDKLMGCYEAALLREPTLTGVVMTTFVITPKGAVYKPTASGVDPALATCIQGVLSKLVFPKPKGGNVEVNYPFTFRP